MSQNPTGKVQELFWAALDVPQEERLAFLETACDDPTVRAEVESLLKYHDTEDGLTPTIVFDRQVGDRDHAVTAGRVRSEAPAPDKIGRYHIKNTIATGGMGTVYEAMQEHPRRTVAVKVLKHGVASRAALRRFDFESQILAHLRHSGIAQVYEAGVHVEGKAHVPYFVMEYIPGARPITEYAKQTELSVREKLELFAKVCDAVQHGHQKGIIHRDLKPANILIDSAGAPKIIDFGVARATDSDLAVTTLQTEVGQLIGTVQYMSPEQVEANPQDIDTRSDVYALGVVLYELLYEQLPYDLSQVQVFEATRIIREATPENVRALDRALRGEVKTIVLKALEKERERRYQSAADLAADIRRFLNNEAIAARPPSVAYQLRVFARRHRSLAAAVALVAIGLAVATIVSIRFAVTAIRAEESTRKEAGKLAAVNAFFLEDLIGSVDPGKTLGRELTVREVFDEAAKRIASIDEPEIEAAARHTIGRAYYSLAKYPQAAEHLQAALEIRRAIFDGDHPDLAASLHDRAMCFRNQGRYTEAESLYDQALAMRRRLLEPDHADIAKTIQAWALVKLERGDLESAEEMNRQALALRRRLYGERHPDVTESVRCLADILVAQGKYDEALRYLETVMAIRREQFDKNSPLLAAAASRLGVVLLKLNRIEEGKALITEALEIRRRVLKPDDTRIAQSLTSLAFAFMQSGQFEEALPLEQEALKIYRESLGERHLYVAKVLVGLSRIQIGMDRHQEAASTLRRSIEIFNDSVDADGQLVASARSHLGGCLVKLGHYPEAEKELRAAYDILGRDNVEPEFKSRTEQHLAELYEAWGKPEEALRWREKSRGRPDATAGKK